MTSNHGPDKEIGGSDSNSLSSSEYIKTVLKRESIKSNIHFDRTDIARLACVRHGLIVFGELLDLFKKEIFYGKTFDRDKFDSELLKLFEALPLNFTFTTDSTANNFNAISSDKEKLRMLHAAMGFTTEGIEFFDSVTASIAEGKELDRLNLIEELGDGTWYIGVAIDILDTSFEHVFFVNDRKLGVRYGDSFDKDRAVNRDLEAERKALGLESKV